MKEYKNAILLSYIHLLIVNVSGLFLLPFIISSIGQADYGLYALIGSFVAYITIFDLGLNSSTIRYISQFRIQNDKKGERNFIANILLIYIGIALTISTIFIILYFNVEEIFSNSLSIIELEKIKMMFLFLILNIIITIPGKIFEGISMGYEKFIFLKLLAIIKTLFRIFLVIFILKNGADSLGLIIIDTIINILYIASTAYYVLFIMKVRPKIYSFSFDYIFDIFSYSIWIFIFSLLFQFQWNIGQIALGITTDTNVVAVFAVGVTLGLYHLSFGKIINTFLLPKTVKQVYDNVNDEEYNIQLIKVSRLILPISVFILWAFVLIGNEFIILWLGNEFTNSWLIALMIMSMYTLQQPQGYIHTILEAKKNVRFKALTMLFSTIIGTLVGFILSQSYGEVGFIVGVTIIMTITYIFLDIYYHKILKLNMLNYYKQTFLPMLVPVIILYFVLTNVFQFIEGTTWMSFSIKLLIYVIMYLIMIYIFYLRKDERSLFWIK